MAYRDKGDFTAAIADFDIVLRLNATLAVGYENRGLTQVKAHHTDAAIADFSQAIELNPKFADAYFNRGRAYASQHKLRQAGEDFTQTIKLAPSGLAYMNRGLVRILQMQEVEARQDFDACLKRDPALKPEFKRYEAAVRKQVAKQIAEEHEKSQAEPPKANATKAAGPNENSRRGRVAHAPAR